MVLPAAVVKEVPPSGPPVPARGEVGSLESGQPNCTGLGLGLRNMVRLKRVSSRTGLAWDPVCYSYHYYLPRHKVGSGVGVG